MHDPEKWKPVFRKDHAPPKCMIRKSGSRFSEKSCTTKMHDPEKWKPVFRKIMHDKKCMIRKSGSRFSEKIMHHQKSKISCRFGAAAAARSRPPEFDREFS
jgi:hypothetical protein